MTGVGVGVTGVGVGVTGVGVGVTGVGVGVTGVGVGVTGVGVGVTGVGVGVTGVGVGVTDVVVLSRIEALSPNLFATAKSGFPSPLKSPMLTETGILPVVKSTLVAKVGVVALVGVVLSRIEALSPNLFATAKSGFPSPLKSPMLTE